MLHSRLDMSRFITHFIHDRNPENDPDWIYGEGEPVRLPYIYDYEKNTRFEDWYYRDEEYQIEPDGTALQVLLKIIDDGHIRSTWSFRGGRPTIYGPRAAVCFTEMPLYALIDYVKRRPTYVQPYGISIRKLDAFRAGIRPVIYGLTGDHQEEIKYRDASADAIKKWPRFLKPSCGIAEQEQYRYVSFNLEDKGYSNWTHEREWRWCDSEDKYSCPGLPLYLDESPNFSIVLIFVPTSEEAQWVLDRLKAHYDTGWDNFGQQLHRQNMLNTRVIALEQVLTKNSLRLEDISMQYLNVMQHPKASPELIEKVKQVLQEAHAAAESAAVSCYNMATKNDAGHILDVCGFASLMIEEPQSELTSALLQLDAIKPLGSMGYMFKGMNYKVEQALCIEEAAMNAAKEVFEKHFPKALFWVYSRWD